MRGYEMGLRECSPIQSASSSKAIQLLQSNLAFPFHASNSRKSRVLLMGPCAVKQADRVDFEPNAF